MSQQILRNLVYYPNGPSGTASDLAALAASPYYSNVVLGQFHFDKNNGTLSWNDTALADVSSDVWAAVAKLAEGEYPKIVSMQIGSAGNGTWTWIANDMAAAAQTLIDVVTGEYPIVGIDLDPEPVGAVALDTIYNFTLQLGSYKSNASFYLSHVPVPWDTVYFPDLYGPQYWPQMAPFVDWITPQWYGTTGGSLASAYEGFVSGLTTPPQPLPPQIVVAGQESSSTSLTDLISAIKSLNTNYTSNWGGVGLWAYPLPTSPDWAEAIYNALQGS